jgi:MFS family permease
MGRLRDNLGALSERQFRLLWLGQSVSGLGDAMALLALPFAVLSITGSATGIGLVMIAWVVSRTALTLLGGVWADRVSRRSLMLASDLVRALTQAAAAALLVTGQARLAHLIVLALVFGAADAFFNPAQTGLVPATVSAGRLQQANALIGVSRSTVALIGPGLAGVMIAALGPGWVYAVDSASFVVSALFLALLRVPAVGRAAERQHLLSDLREGWREVAARTWVWASILYFAVVNMATTAIFVLGPLVAVRSLGGAEAWGAVGSAATAGSIAGGLAAVRLRPRRPLLAGTLAVATIALESALLARPFPLPVIAASAFIGFAGVSFDSALWYTALQQHVPERSLSRVSSYDWMGSFVFQPIGLAAAGPLAAAVGLGQTLLASAALVLTSSAAILLVPSVRQLRRVDAEPLLEPAEPIMPAG